MAATPVVGVSSTPTSSSLPKVIDGIVSEYSTHPQIVMFDGTGGIATLTPQITSPNDNLFGWQLFPANVPKIYKHGDNSELVTNKQFSPTLDRRGARAYITKVRRTGGDGRADTLIIRPGGWCGSDESGTMDIAVISSTTSDDIKTANSSSSIVSDTNNIEWTRYALPYTHHSSNSNIRDAITYRENYASVIVNDKDGFGEFFCVFGGHIRSIPHVPGGFTTTCDVFHIPTRRWYPKLVHESSRVNFVRASTVPSSSSSRRPVAGGMEKKKMASVASSKKGGTIAAAKPAKPTAAAKSTKSTVGDDIKEGKAFGIPNLPAEIPPTSNIVTAIGPVIYMVYREGGYSYDTSLLSAAIAAGNPSINTTKWVRIAAPIWTPHSFASATKFHDQVHVWRNTLLLIGTQKMNQLAQQYNPVTNSWRFLAFNNPQHIRPIESNQSDYDFFCRHLRKVAVDAGGAAPTSDELKARWNRAPHIIECFTSTLVSIGGRDIIYAIQSIVRDDEACNVYSLDITDDFDIKTTSEANKSLITYMSTEGEAQHYPDVAVRQWNRLPVYPLERRYPVVQYPIVLPSQYFIRSTPTPATVPVAVANTVPNATHS